MPYDPPDCPELLRHVINSFRFDGKFDPYSDNTMRLITHSADLAHQFHKGQTRITGGPYTTHLKEVLGVIFDSLDEYNQKANHHVNLPAHVIITAILHDGVEDEEGLSFLNKQLKENGKGPKIAASIKERIVNRRAEVLDTRISELSDIVEQTIPHEKHPVYANLIKNVKNRVDTLTRYEEKYLFHESMYKIFDILPDRQDDLTSLLERALVKLSDRVANQEDNRKRYGETTGQELQTYLEQNEMLIQRYGNIDLLSNQSLSYAKATHSIWKSIIVLDAIDRGLMSKYKHLIENDNIENDNNQYHKALLGMIVNVRQRLCRSVSRQITFIKTQIGENYLTQIDKSNAYSRAYDSKDSFKPMLQRWQKSDQSKSYLKDLEANPTKSDQTFRDMISFQSLVSTYYFRKDFTSKMTVDVYSCLDNPANILVLPAPKHHRT